MNITGFYTLAQNDPAGGGGAPVGPNGAPAGGAPPGGGLFGGPFMLIMILLLGFMILSSVLAGRKDKRKRAEMMANLGKNAKVQTVGGVIGTVVELKNDELLLEVDKASNTRIRFARSAVQQVLKPGLGTPAAEAQDAES